MTHDYNDKDEIPRRCDANKRWLVEAKIYEAIAMVENMIADPRLTEAVVLLERAAHKVADVIDSRLSSATPPSPSAPTKSPDLDLLRKFVDGMGGERTGALYRAGYLRWWVTNAGRHALGLPTLDVEMAVDGKGVYLDQKTLTALEARLEAAELRVQGLERERHELEACAAKTEEVYRPLPLQRLETAVRELLAAEQAMGFALLSGNLAKAESLRLRAGWDHVMMLLQELDTDRVSSSKLVP